MKKFGMPFCFWIIVFSIAICWRLLTGHFPSNETGLIFILVFIYGLATEAYKGTQMNTEKIDELVLEIETLKDEIGELQDSLPEKNFKHHEDL
jgi:hypothetical protein